MNRLFFTLTISFFLSGCGGSRTEEILFKHESQEVNIYIIYSGTAGRNDGKVSVEWRDNEFGQMGMFKLIEDSEFSDHSGVVNASYNRDTRMLNVVVQYDTDIRDVDIPILITKRHMNNFIRDNHQAFKNNIESP